MPPDRADLHPAHGLPDILPIGDFSLRDHRLAVCRHHFTRNGWTLPKNFRTDPSQDRERNHENRDKDQPKPFHILSFCFQVKRATPRHSLSASDISSRALPFFGELLDAGDHLLSSQRGPGWKFPRCVLSGSEDLYVGSADIDNQHMHDATSPCLPGLHKGGALGSDATRPLVPGIDEQRGSFVLKPCG